MTATLLSVNNSYYPRGGAEVVFFRHNGMLQAAGWSVVALAAPVVVIMDAMHKAARRVLELRRASQRR